MGRVKRFATQNLKFGYILRIAYVKNYNRMYVSINNSFLARTFTLYAL